MSDGFTLTEGEVANRAGIPEAEVAAARKSGAFAGCWGHVKLNGRRQYAWSEAGLTRLAGGEPQKAAAPVVETMLVHRGPDEGMRNALFIEAVRASDDGLPWQRIDSGKVFAVRVRSNEHFARKTRGGARMEVRVRITGERRGELVGPCPRSKGVY